LPEDVDRRLLVDGGFTAHPFDLWDAGEVPLRGEVLKIRLDDPDGRPVGLLGVVIDRTRQFDTEQQLLEAQALHHVVVEAISDAVFVLDGDSRPLFVTPNVASIFGTGPEEVLALESICALFGCEDCGILSLPRDCETCNLERSVIGRNGTRRELLVSVKPIDIGMSRWLVTCRDVTERVEALSRAKASMAQTVQALCAAVEQRDPYVVGHQDRVADLAVAIGRRKGLDDSSLEGLRMAAIVHDVGKISVPGEILSKPGKLSVPEFEIVKTHAENGYQILKDIAFPWPLARMVREHHEAMDGSGYPLGLTGDQLLPESRILSVADVLEAVTSHRPYRAGMGLGRALEVLNEMRGHKLDPEAVDICVELIEAGELSVPGWTGTVEPVGAG